MSREKTRKSQWDSAGHSSFQIGFDRSCTGYQEDFLPLPIHTTSTYVILYPWLGLELENEVTGVFMWTRAFVRISRIEAQDTHESRVTCPDPFGSWCPIMLIKEETNVLVLSRRLSYQSRFRTST